MKAIFILPFLLFAIAGYCQSNLDSLTRKLSDYRNTHLQEKIFVHLDRTTHIVGETMWFRIYDVNGTTHQPLRLSRVAYVEILDRDNRSVIQGKLELHDGFGEGSFFLPATLKTGNFVLRAYTQWMRNYDAGFFFHQPITIINPFQARSDEPGNSTVRYDAQFLPEGGHLVEGIRSTIGFRVTDTDGKGIQFKGSLTDERGDTVARFLPSQFGIGTFAFTPTAGKYKAIIRDVLGNVVQFPFPEVNREGYALAVDRSGDIIQVHVEARLRKERDNTVQLLVHTRNQIVEAASQELISGKTTFYLPKKDLLSGITHITLFDEHSNAVCERLIFKLPETKLLVETKTSKAFYHNRETVKLSLAVNDETNLPAVANLSIAVHKVDSLPSLPTTDINTYLYLTSDLHGAIESPDWYLRPGSEQAIDQLMLTHGWRRFSWKDVFDGSTPARQPEAQGLVVRGKLVTHSGDPAPGVLGFLSFPSRNNSFFTTRSKPNGDFNFLLKKVYGDGKIILQTNFSRDSIFSFKLESPFSDDRSKFQAPPLIIHPAFERMLIERSMSMQVQDIFKKEAARKIFSQDTTAFYGKADETYFLDDYTRFTVMEEVMREYVPGVLVRKRKGKFIFLAHDVVNKATFKEEPLVLIDGVPVFDTDKIMSFDPLKIRKLEVLTKLFFHGQTAFSGIVSYSTYKGDLAGFEPHRKSEIHEFAGLQTKKEFYQPKYDTQEQRISRIPDERNLLLWAPDVMAKNGRSELEFTTSDQSGYFQIEIQAISPSGRAGSARQIFYVSPDTGN